MGQRKCAAAFLLAEEMYQIPATKSVILARDLGRKRVVSPRCQAMGRGHV